MKCIICNKEVKNICIHISKKQDIHHKKFVKKIYSELDPLLKTSLFVREIDEIFIEKYGFSIKSFIGKRSKELFPIRRLSPTTERRRGKNNPVFTNDTINKIKRTVKKSWDNGKYENRINGMLGKTGKLNSRFKIRKHLKPIYNEICEMYHNGLRCISNNCKYDNNIINVHHVDENHSNFLISNLEPYCVSHHMNFHYKKNRKLQPFVEVTRDFKFDSAHNLLNYEGKCKNLHGHTYFLSISIKKRVNQETGMVIDFSILNKVVNDYIIDEFDHKYINDIMKENPTAENMLIWIWERLEKVALLKGLSKIKIWESPESSAEVTKEDMLNSDFYLDTYYNDLEKFRNNK